MPVSSSWRVAAVLVGGAALFVVPLALTGELGVWVFSEPVSHLVWDEAMRGPGDPGGPSPGPGAELSSPLRAAWALALLPGLLALVVSSWARRLTPHP